MVSRPDFIKVAGKMQKDVSHINPYKDLYIYYLEGYLKSNPPLGEENFIGNWEEDGYSYLFYSRSSDQKVRVLLEADPGVKLLDQFYMTYDQWHGGDDAPLCVGNFVVSPPWKQSVAKNDLAKGVKHILLDPGVVFGTGLHPTTRDCLEAIEMAFCDKKPEFVIDIGTGTGILALAAAMISDCKTLAVDFNLLSVQTTRKNVCINRLENKILPIQGKGENSVDYPVDFMIANIHYEITRKIIESKEFYQKKRFLLSGLLNSEAKSVKNKLLQHNVELIKTWDQNGIWFTFLGEIH